MKLFNKEATDQYILIHIDNTSAISATNKMSTMVSVWAQSTKNWTTATHVPEFFNVEADKKKSRFLEERTEWMLSKIIFDDITKQLEFKPDIYLFASKLIKQILKYVSFRSDSVSIAVNAFKMNWVGGGIKTFMHFHYSLVYHVCCKKYGRT